ncbi:MAG: PD-(D/E)XK nuclease-like domain-containing protein [Akkermansia sp.]|nr:PD-(D/E)XK nuclease-like domain-containing protein [Akkermansia sp.]MBR5186391.1 PD-(D/E)XK nuclease-like domain-containing protein [Akkermansia sp.]
MQNVTATIVAEALNTTGTFTARVNPQVYHAIKPELEALTGYPVISKSNLHDFMACPYRYNFNRTHGIRKESKEMSLGSLVDCLTLTPELFDSQYKCEPIRVQLKKDGTPYADGRQDPAQKAEWQAMAEQGITIITEEQLAKAKAISAAALEHMESIHLTKARYTTQEACWVLLREVNGNELVTPVIVCIMVDIVPNAGCTLKDLKTTSVDLANDTKIFYQIEDYGYHLQGALYTFVYTLCTGRDMCDFSLLFVSTTEPYMTRRVVLTEDTLEQYLHDALRAISAYAVAWKLQDFGTPQLNTLYYTPTAKEFRRRNDF